jgi:signal transduction histidine kinase
MWLASPRDFYGAALIRVFGAILAGAACCAVGLAAVEDPEAQRRGMLWFAIGHAVVAVVVVAQRIAIWGRGGDSYAQVLTLTTLSLFFLWYASGQKYPPGALTTVFGGSASASAVGLRSRYEQQVREAGAQEERNRLARELHDSIKQQIFVIQTAAATAQARYEGDAGGAKQALEQVRGSARDAMTEMEVLLDQLRAEPLENAGLIEALKKQCEALGLRTGAKVEFQLGELKPSKSFSPGAQQAILRVAQEALANVGRHARAQHVWVRLGTVAGRAELSIRDDGAGFDPNQSRRGMGTANMHTRAEEFGGSFELASAPGSGTTVRFSVPYADRGAWSARNVRTLGALWMVTNMFMIFKATAVTIASCVVLALAYVYAEYRSRKQKCEA